VGTLLPRAQAPAQTFALRTSPFKGGDEEVKTIKLIGLSNLQEMLGLTKSGIHWQWKNGKLPIPFAEWNGSPLWREEQFHLYKKDSKTSDSSR
jgi:hypothetical protein